MKICHVSRKLCPRMVKLAWCQTKQGDEVHWVGERQPSFQKTLPFESMGVGHEVRFGGALQALGAIESQVELFHVHTHYTDTDLLEQVMRTVAKPVFWDCHDEPMGGIPDHFPKKFRLAPIEKYMAGGISYRTYCPGDWFPDLSEPEYGLVITTGLSDQEGHERHWEPTFKTMYDEGWKVRCYTFSEVPPSYHSWADMREPVDVRQLLKEMSKATVGICGSPNPRNENMINAQPNKLYEYVAAGIPVVCFGSNLKMAETIRWYSLGVVIDDPKDITEAVKKAAEMRSFIGNFSRFNFDMANQAQRVKHFYRKCLHEN